MNDTFEVMIQKLTQAIQDSYDEGITMEQAEKLAGKFLFAQMQIAEKLSRSDLDARMQKTGVKAIKAGVYLQEATKGEKKPTESMLSALVDSDEAVVKAQDMLDKAEIRRDELENYFSIFKEAHVHFRTIARGRFE